MKKLVLTIAIVLGMALGATAQFSQNNNNSGLFQRGYVSAEEYYDGYRDASLISPRLPNHLQDDNQDAPLGSGIALLLGMGAAYMVAKKRKED